MRGPVRAPEGRRKKKRGPLGADAGCYNSSQGRGGGSDPKRGSESAFEARVQSQPEGPTGRYESRV